MSTIRSEASPAGARGFEVWACGSDGNSVTTLTTAIKLATHRAQKRLAIADTAFASVRLSENDLWKWRREDRMQKMNELSPRQIAGSRISGRFVLCSASRGGCWPKR